MNNIENDFNKIYEETYDGIFKFVIYKCDDLSYVNDLIQEVYMDVYEIIKKKGSNYIRNNNKFIYYLAKKRIFKYYNLKNKFKITFAIDLNFSCLDNEEYKSHKLDNIVSQEIEEELLQKFTADEIWQEIIKEDLINQKILVLYYLEDLKIKEISEVLSLNENTVKTKLFRVTNKLKERLGNIESERRLQ